MSKFQVCVQRMEWAYFEVDAPTTEKAYELAIEDAYNSDFHNAFAADYELGSITKLEDEDDSSM